MLPCARRRGGGGCRLENGEGALVWLCLGCGLNLWAGQVRFFMAPADL